LSLVAVFVFLSRNRQDGSVLNFFQDLGKTLIHYNRLVIFEKNAKTA